MPRKPRFYLPGVPVHVVQRGHSREPVFFDTPDYQTYLHWLGEAAKRYGCAIHAYVLMTNHIHLLITPRNKNSISQVMQYTGRHFVPYINVTYGTSGTCWEGRYKASLIQDETYLLTCMRYIEMNPVRAGMVKSPGAYRWSSYGANALGKNDALVNEHTIYTALGKNHALRIRAYLDLFKAQVDDDALNEIRASWQTGTPLGNDHFKQKIEAKLQCKVGQARRGRPFKGL
ncbi:MAG: transposase [Gammaproteobacteria bacterium]|nr:transposase [Gammaproteobacteria bacterium]